MGLKPTAYARNAVVILDGMPSETAELVLAIAKLRGSKPGHFLSEIVCEFLSRGLTIPPS